jgi:hypothetical protein
MSSEKTLSSKQSFVTAAVTDDAIFVINGLIWLLSRAVWPWQHCSNYSGIPKWWLCVAWFERDF